MHFRHISAKIQLKNLKQRFDWGKAPWPPLATPLDRYSKNFHRYLDCGRYSNDHWYRYSKICLPIYLLIHKVFWLKLLWIAYSTD